MEKIGKKDLARELRMKCECFTSDAKAECMIGKVFEVITKEITDGKEVAIPGFGKFTVVERAARQGVNPQTQEKIHIPASKTVKFKVSKTLKDMCN